MNYPYSQMRPDQRQLAERRAALLRSIAKCPKDKTLLEELARVQAVMGELASAEHYAAAAVAAGGGPGARRLLAELAASQGKWEVGAAAIEPVLAAHATDPEPWRDWAWVLHSGGAFARARAFLERARAAFPDDFDLVYKLGLALWSLGRADEAVATMESACRRWPGQPELLRGLALVMNSAAGLDASRVFEAHRAAGLASAGAAKRRHDRAGRPTWDNDRGERLRVGILSSDLRRHSVAYFASALFAHHQGSGVELWAYSTAAREDDVSRRLADGIGSGRWRSLGRTGPGGVAEAIERDGIDVLVELNGLSSGSNIEVLLRRPAPVQATYLGYPNTTGLACVDFRLVDERSDPSGGAADALCVERLVRLPRCGWCYHPGLGSEPPDVDDGPEGGRVTFGSFNALSKVNDRTLRLWARVLSSVPGSRLLMKAHGLQDEPTRSDVGARAAACGVPAGALELRGRVEPRMAHLRAYGEASIALDPFPYHGTTTTCEALLMGVPVVTLAGGEHRSRVGVSLLEAVGLGELVAMDEDAYVAIAMRLARETARRTVLRRELRAQLLASELCDGAGFARAFGVAAQSMARMKRGE